MITKPKLGMLAFVLAFPPLVAAAQSAPTPDFGVERTTTAKSSEIPIGYASTTSPQRRVIYSLGPFRYRFYYWNHTYLGVQFQVGLTKRCAGTTRVGYYIVRALSPDATNGLYLTRYAVVDLPERPNTPENPLSKSNEATHHVISQSSDSVHIYPDMEFKNAYYNVVMFADSYDASCVGQTLQVKGNEIDEYAGELTITQDLTRS